VDYSNAPYSAFLVDVTGRIASTPAQPAPVVTLSFHGNGYTLNGQGGSTPNSIQLRFTGHPGPNPVNTSQTGIVGKLTGTMSGRTPFGEKSAIINLDTVIEDVVSTPLKIQAQVEQSSKRMLLFNADFNGNGAGNPVFDLTGSGQVNHSADTYRFMAHGIGLEKGWNLTVTGTLADRPSNVFPGTQFSAPATAQVTGKIQGQVVSGSTTDIQAELISGN
jgi:hypothetical protein